MIILIDFVVYYNIFLVHLQIYTFTKEAIDTIPALCYNNFVAFWQFYF
jgi:hypothetical protein